MPTVPLIIFYSGDRAVFVREVPITRGNVRYSGIYMILDEQTLWRYGINDKDLDYTISVYGAYYMEYPTEYIKNRSLNPENPMYIALCNFDGSITIDSDIQLLSSQINNLKQDIDSLLTEVEVLHGRLKHEIEVRKELERKLDGSDY